MAKASKKSSKKGKSNKPVKVSYHRRPDDMKLELWQLGLRKQFGEENEFHITNTGSNPVFSEFIVWNPSSNSSYTVNIRTGIPKKGLPPENTLTSIGNTCNCQDFKTNRLGLCKHISATLHQVLRQRGTKKIMAAGYRPLHSMIYVDYRHGRRIRLFVGAKHESQLLKWGTRLSDTEGFLAPETFPLFDTLLWEARQIQPEFTCTDDVFDLIAEEQERRRLKERLTQVLPNGPADKYLDKLLKVKLFPYQKRGVWFAANAGRCLIADEMGLGKTVQAIGTAELLRREMNVQRILIVCPTSLKYQWKTEIEKFTSASVHVVEGLQSKRLIAYEKHKETYFIISYNTMASDADYLHIPGADLLIIDEAQRIKNFRTKVSAQLKKVRTQYCVVLTGTPLENKLEDLYSIIQFVDQYKLPPLYQFLDRYQITSDSGQVMGYRNLKEIGEKLSDCMIRRVKKEMLVEMPKRIDRVLFVSMTREQSNIHRDLADNVARLVAKWRKFHFLSETERRILLLCLSQMRMVADSTYILDQKTRHDNKITELMYILEEALADPDQKIVIFSQWERMTRLVAQELDATSTGYASLHGGIPSTERADLLKRFREDPACRIFLSTDAGGTGLNLQSASMLINLDIPWNPAILEQRVARIHRMGQKENVTVINMVSSESIEQRMLGLLEFKSSMAQGVLDPDGDDTIFMSESKFKQFMEKVENMSGENWQTPATETPGTGSDQTDGEDLEQPAQATRTEVGETGKNRTEHLAPVRGRKKKQLDEEQQQDIGALRSSPPATPQELVQSGISFLSGLAQTLSSPEKTKELVETLVATDEETGQTYLKIPVENAAVVENAVKLLGGLLSGLGRG